VEERLAAALKQQLAVTEEELPPPAVAIGDKVTRGSSDTVYEISYVSASGHEVNLSQPGTNLERYPVPVGELTMVNRKAANTAIEKPASLYSTGYGNLRVRVHVDNLFQLANKASTRKSIYILLCVT